MKVSELSGALLDAWVALALGAKPYRVGEPLEGTVRTAVVNSTMIPHCILHESRHTGDFFYSPSTDWRTGGPIIDREQIIYRHHAGGIYEACKMTGEIGVNRKRVGTQHGRTLLEAAMRAYVASKYGASVPDDFGVA